MCYGYRFTEDEEARRQREEEARRRHKEKARRTEKDRKPDRELIRA